MSLTKRLRVMAAALFQEWHEKTCGECGFTWMAVGACHPELITSCDQCQMREMERFLDHAEAHYHQMGGAL